MNIKKMLLTLLLCMLAALLPACNNGSDGNGSSIPTADHSESQSEAYYLMFGYLFQEDTGLNGGIKYITVDLTKSKLSNQEYFLALMEDFCSESGYTLLTGTIDELEEEGYINDLYFKDGIVVSFNDSELTDSLLVTNAEKWRSGTGAIGHTFTAEKNSIGEWELEVTGSWIS